MDIYKDYENRETVIRLQDVFMKYGKSKPKRGRNKLCEEKYALNGIELEVKRGEFLFLVGPSGAGKSTFIKLLMKELDITRGRIHVAGSNLSKMHKRKVPFHRRKIGIVFQDFRLISKKTVYENVAFAMEMIETPQKEIRRQVPMILSIVGLADKQKSYPSQLSGGEKQRVSIARALINKPKILIADEPTGNLDPETSNGIMELLKQINRRGTTIIMATHNKEIVNKMQKRVIALDNGKIVRDEVKGGYSYEN
jgi:cell division transport system ATP-binding protein